MAVLAHISDLHFGRENHRIVDELLVHITLQKPDLIVISGDLTQRARSREYRAAQEFLGKLSQPYLVIPGNHDMSASNLAERFFFPWSKWYAHIGTDLEPINRGAGFVVAGVNTCRRLGALFNWSRGRISVQQSEQVSRCFTDSDKGRLRVVAAHHPFWLPRPYQHRHLVGGRDAAITYFSEAGVDLILSGHVHFAYSHVLSGIIISHAGTAVSNRLLPNSPNSFKIIRGDMKAICIETCVWNGKRFSVSLQEYFTKNENGWNRS